MFRWIGDLFIIALLIWSFVVLVTAWVWFVDTTSDWVADYWRGLL